MDTVVIGDYRGYGVGSKLIEARYDLIRALNLRGLIAGSLIADYYTVADTVSVEQYVRDVQAGKRFDSNLTKQLHKGFEAIGIIPNYTIDDRSLGYGVEIVWHNPDYRPRPARPAWRRPLQRIAPLRPALSYSGLVR